jgi:hypothetical protein
LTFLITFNHVKDWTPHLITFNHVKGWTPLILAAYKGDPTTLQVLIEAKAELEARGVTSADNKVVFLLGV